MGFPCPCDRFPHRSSHRAAATRLNSVVHQPRIRSTADAQRITQVAIPVPVRRCFDFLAPVSAAPLPRGTRVRVPFGRRHLTGVVMGTTDTSDVSPERLRKIERVLDTEPVFEPPVFDWLCWVARYYHHPPCPPR